jgi:hypothetical protein
MDIIEKARSGAVLSQDELNQLVISMNTELATLKEKDPEEYLKLVRELTDVIVDLRASINQAQ